MAQLVLGTVGAIIGGIYGGPSGAQAGWVIGSVVGGILDPQVTKIEGPRLTDLKVQDSRYGSMIPIIFGTMRAAGNVIWSTDKIETKTVASEGGKGGPSTQSTNYTYSVDCAIAICKGPIGGVLKIFANGRLIYSQAQDASLETQAESARLARTFQVYLGNEIQMPDATMEAALGVGNVPAYRGLAYCVVSGLQLADFGNQLPNFEFIVVPVGSGAGGSASVYASTTEYVPCELEITEFPWTINNWIATATWPQYPGLGNLFPVLQAGLNPTLELEGSGYYALDFSMNGCLDTIWVRVDTISNHTYATTAAINCIETSSTGYVVRSSQGDSRDRTYRSISFPSTGEIYWAQCCTLIAPRGDCPGNDMGTPTQDVTGNFCISGDGVYSKKKTYVKLGSRNGPFQWVVYKKGMRRQTECPHMDLGPVMLATDPRNTAAWWTAYELANPVSNGSGTYHMQYEYTGGLSASGSAGMPVNEVATASDSTTYVVPAAAALADIVTTLLGAAGLGGAVIDVTALTDTVYGYSITTQMSVRDAIYQLTQSLHFDAVESDGKIRFVKRGGASAVTIPFDDLGAHLQGNPAGDPVAISRAQEVDLPQRVTVNFLDCNADFQPGSESAQRIVTPSKQQLTLNFAIAMTPDAAAKIAEVLLYDAHVARSTMAVALTRKYARFEPADVIDVVAENTTYKLRVVSREDSGDILKLSCVQYDPAVYASSAQGTAQLPVQSQIEAPGFTHAQYLDIPILQDADDNAGIYVALGAIKSKWTGAQLYRSIDDLVFNALEGVSISCVMGTATTALGNWLGGNMVDEGNAVTVVVESGALSSYTYDQVLAGSGLVLLGNEILAYRTATLIAAKTYTLTGLLRGRNGTNGSQGSHVAGERFVALSGAGMLRVNEGNAAIGASRYFRAVSFGHTVDETASNTVVYAGGGLKPLPPCNLGGARQPNNDWMLTWVRRTRVGGAWVNYADALLGETSESYSIDIMSGTTVKRTLTSSTPAVTYTAAQQTADFGAAQTTLTVNFYQVSGSVGRGLVATRTF